MGGDRIRSCQGGQRVFREDVRDLLEDPLVGPMEVVMLGIGAKQPFKVPGVEDEQMVETLGSDCSHESLGISVGVGRAKRRLDDSGAF